MKKSSSVERSSLLRQLRGKKFYRIGPRTHVCEAQTGNEREEEHLVKEMLKADTIKHFN